MKALTPLVDTIGGTLGMVIATLFAEIAWTGRSARPPRTCAQIDPVLMLKNACRLP